MKLKWHEIPLQLMGNDRLELNNIPSARQERISEVYKLCRGDVLDIGCGKENYLVRNYESEYSLGVDNCPDYDYDKDKRMLYVEDIMLLKTLVKFDTVTLIALFNYIEDKHGLIKKIKTEFLKPDGRIIVTNFEPTVGLIRQWTTLSFMHPTKYKKPPGYYGSTKQEMIEYFGRHGFVLKHYDKLCAGLSHLYVFRRGDLDKIEN